MSNRSLSASGDQTTRHRLALGIRRARWLDNLFDVEFIPFPGVELPYTDFEGSPKLGQGIDAFEHFPPELLLGSVRKRGRFRDRDFQCPYDGLLLYQIAVSMHDEPSADLDRRGRRADAVACRLRSEYPFPSHQSE